MPHLFAGPGGSRPRGRFVWCPAKLRACQRSGATSRSTALRDGPRALGIAQGGSRARGRRADSPSGSACRRLSSMRRSRPLGEGGSKGRNGVAAPERGALLRATPGAYRRSVRRATGDRRSPVRRPSGVWFPARRSIKAVSTAKAGTRGRTSRRGNPGAGRDTSLNTGTSGLQRETAGNSRIKVRTRTIPVSRVADTGSGASLGLLPTACPESRGIRMGRVIAPTPPPPTAPPLPSDAASRPSGR